MKGPEQKTLAPGRPWVNHQVASGVSFLIRGSFGQAKLISSQTISLVPSEISFLSSGRILPDPSVPKQTLVLHDSSHYWNERKPDCRFLQSPTEVLVKYCFRVLDYLVHCSLWKVHGLVSNYPASCNKLIRTAVCWLPCYFGSNSIIFLQKVTLITLTFLGHQLDASSSPILLSLLPFWTPGLCTELSDARWPAPPNQ